jgi:hypothetical protein
MANGIKINHEKSAILELRPDQRTKNRLGNRYHNYPVLKSYKYLGLIIDNDGTLREDTCASK